MATDNYTREFLKKNYYAWKTYALLREESKKYSNKNIRLPALHEDISENIIKFAIHDLGDTTCIWKNGCDLYSELEMELQCKSFISDGPISFSPTPKWRYIYFLDARKWKENFITIYRANITSSSDIWKNIKVNRKDTFNDQATKGRRPRISWNLLYEQISMNVEIIYQDDIDKLFENINSSESSKNNTTLTKIKKVPKIIKKTFQES